MTTLGVEYPIDYIIKYNDLRNELLERIGEITFPIIATIEFVDSRLYEDFNNLTLTFKNNTPMDERDPLNYIFRINLEDATIKTFQKSISGKELLIK